MAWESSPFLLFEWEEKLLFILKGGFDLAGKQVARFSLSGSGGSRRMSNRFCTQANIVPAVALHTLVVSKTGQRQITELEAYKAHSKLLGQTLPLNYSDLSAKKPAVFLVTTLSTWFAEKMVLLSRHPGLWKLGQQPIVRLGVNKTHLPSWLNLIWEGVLQCYRTSSITRD